MELFEANKHLHAKHDKTDAAPAANRPPPPPPPSSTEANQTAPAPAPAPASAPTAAPPAAGGGLSDVCCTPADEIMGACPVPTAAPSTATATAAATAATGPGDGGGPVMNIRLGILTVSDRATSGVYEDESGPEIKRAMETYASTTGSFRIFSVLYYAVPDDVDAISRRIREMSASGCSLILTTGGTGCASRDVTPEATVAVLHKLVPGIPEAIRGHTMRYEPHAMLSRAVAGIRDRTLVINLPGRPKAVRENLGVLMPVLAHAVAQVTQPL